MGQDVCGVDLSLRLLLIRGCLHREKCLGGQEGSARGGGTLKNLSVASICAARSRAVCGPEQESSLALLPEAS